MASMIGNMIKNSTDINDEVIASSMLASGKAAADAYLNATMASTTPELRAVYAASLNQIVGGHSALTELSVKRGWEKPYSPPTEQLSEVYSKSRMMVESQEK